MRELSIIRVEENVNMRFVRLMREEKFCRSLKPGQCVVAINGRETIARILDCRGSYTMYAPEKTVFDIGTIKGWMSEGLGVIINETDTTKYERQPTVPMSEIHAEQRERQKRYNAKRKGTGRSYPVAARKRA